jgi:hypothetical protein
LPRPRLVSLPEPLVREGRGRGKQDAMSAEGTALSREVRNGRKRRARIDVLTAAKGLRSRAAECGVDHDGRSAGAVAAPRQRVRRTQPRHSLRPVNAC